MSEGIMSLLKQKYAELEEACYRAATASRSENGRLQGRYVLPPAVVTKMDLDKELKRIVARFFTVS